MLQTNQRVIISNAAGDDVFGRVEEVRPVAEVSASVREALAAWGVSRIAAITYHSSPAAQHMVTAVEIEGAWFDLDHKPLHIEVVGLHECASGLPS
jgi:hypothetical protein